MLELLNMPAFASADPAMISGAKAFRITPFDEEAADFDTLYKAACTATEMDAMARSIDLRVHELKAVQDVDGSLDGDILRLSAQEQMFREIASQLRCTRSKSALTAALSSAAIAQAMFGSAKSVADHAVHDEEDEASHNATAKAVAAAKACYDVPIKIVRSRAIFRVVHVLREENEDKYSRYAADSLVNSYMRDPSTTDVLSNFKETLSRVEISKLTPDQQRSVAEINASLNEARMNAFNVTDTRVDNEAIAVTAAALGDDFNARFKASNASFEGNAGMTVSEFLSQARMSRGFAPVDAMRMAEYRQKITELSQRQQTGTLSTYDQLDLDCYQQALLQAEIINTYFESQRELKAATTLRAQMELLLVEDNLLKLDGLPPEAIDVHLGEARQRIDVLKAGTAVTEGDVSSATATIHERLKYLLTPPSPAIMQLKDLISSNDMKEVYAAADTIKLDMDCEGCSCMPPIVLSRYQTPQFEMA